MSPKPVNHWLGESPVAGGAGFRRPMLHLSICWARFRRRGVDTSRGILSVTLRHQRCAPPGNPRFELMDSVRALAAVAILLSHVVAVERGNGAPALLRGLGASVPIFFALSGFLLYRPFVAGRRGGTTPQRIGRYAWRRLLCILPAYWLALTALAIYGSPGMIVGEVTRRLGGVGV